MFSNKKIIQHYARVFFEHSIINVNDSELFYHKIKKMSFLLNNDIYINEIIYTNLLNSEKKIKIFKKILYNFDILLFKFVKLLIIKKRELFLKEIFLKYQKIYEENQKGFIKSVIISAFPLKKDMQKMIAQKIISNKKFHIFNKIDKSIVGGFIFRVGYKEWNFSVQEQLLHIKKIFYN
ncbi:FoF1 ATP synthase subunit delta [Blattabacterium sp. (Blaberus giganteus)]|uniref:F0F1 ATP synthase subunit delta n=1 Tax=Blattabacterium sp. (Blaberus giganteus) TaxID=1186051 RepID=UPI00025F6E44|nr:F0F1 ATP synthase subunit delta [Blattabacterium sp. (Blaberus giganteus)]AFJ90531.1 ATP synthase F1 subunit delta [Blattabacterium sp. (Blaberus giganteus)]